MLKKLTLSLMAIVMGFAAYAQNNDSILGKWVQTATEGGMLIVMSYDFQPDGTLVQEFNITGSQPRIAMSGMGQCPYTYSDGTITFDLSKGSVDFTTFEIEGVDPSYYPMIKEQQKSMMTGEQKITDVEISGKTLTAKLGDDEITLMRAQ